jgi:heme exporter protein A
MRGPFSGMDAPLPAPPAPAPAEPSAPGAAIAAHGLWRRFGERDALADVGFRLAPGETLAVLGSNGAGKTTLLRVLATLLRPHRGEVSVLGFELPRQAQDVRAQIGLLAHEPLLYLDLTGRENLEFYARLYKVAHMEARIEALLEAAGMSRRADEPLRSLSRGMVQRLAVCRAVLHSPALLLLDEPWSHLDPEADALVEPLIGRASEATRVIVTHDVDRGLAEADRVLALHAGRVALSAPAADLTAASLRPVYGAR